ncbi:terminase large subunit [Flavobacterium sp. 3-210]
MKITNQMLASVPFQYANDVRTGKIVTGKKIKQAVERFYSWIETADQDGFVLDHNKGMQIVNFFPAFLNHTKGKLAGKPFVLEPFQAFTMYNVFGWMDSTGKRRISTVYDKRAKKNGKSAEMAGLSLFCMSFDMEMEAECYVGATKEDQAKICWRQAAQFVQSPVANRNLQKMGFFVQQKKIGFTRTASFMSPLGGDSSTQDGVNAHLSIIDEYHAHKDDSVKENLESSSVQRKQPLLWHITTAGSNKGSVCKNYEDSVIEVLNGQKTDNHLWIMIHDLDEGDDWQDQSVWIKANPLLGNGLDIAQMQREFIKAVNQPSKIPNFKTKHLNMWVDGLSAWIPAEEWTKNKVEIEDYKAFVLEKAKEFGSNGGLDLSSVADITAFVILTNPDDEGNQYLIVFLFCPEDNIDRRSKNDGVPYRYWVDAGFMIATPGNRVDYNYLKRYIRDNFETFNIQRIDADPWNASSLLSELVEMEIPVSELSQIMSRLNHPTKMLEKLIYDGKIKHDGNPVMDWMLAACVPIEDSKGNIMLSKKESHKNKKRIDGWAALVNALAAHLSPDEDDANESYYNDPNHIFEC